MTTRVEIEEQVMIEAAEAFALPMAKLSLDLHADSLRAWDSFSHVALVAALEEHYGIEIPPQESAYFEKLEDFVKAFENRLCG